ncbi:MAG: EamA family transporter [Bryobacteraceae bacterium]
MLVFFCTFIGAAAQIFMKLGANHLPAVGALSLLANPMLVMRNYWLVTGVSLYGCFTILLIFALRDGELSILYPVIALNYVWVTILSLIFFDERMNPFKALGVATIVLGVVILGKGGKR